MIYIDEFCSYLKKRDLSQNTVESYKRDVYQFLSFINKSVEDIEKRDLDIYNKYLEEKQISVSSINRKLISLKNFFYFLNDEYNLGFTFRVKKLKKQNQQYLDDILGKTDFDRLVNSAKENGDKRAEVLFYTLYLTGMRVSEVLQLDAEDTDKNYISIRGKGSKYRTVFIPPKLQIMLKEYKSQRIDKGGKLFTGQRGSINRQTVHNIIKKYADLANVRIDVAHAHNFRHLYCLSLVEKGLSIDVVADLAGHSNINTTRIYTRKTKEQLMEAINEL